MAASLDSDQTNKQETTAAGSDALARLSALPAALLWHSSAPAGLRAAWKSDPHGDGWKKLRKLLASRRLPKSLQPKGKKRPQSLAWAAPASLASSPGLLETPETSIEQWVDRCDHRQADPPFVLECLAWAGHLPAVAQQVQSEVWWRLVEQLVEVARQTIQVSLGEEPTADKAYAQQALGGELPFMLSQLIPELLPLRGLPQAGHNRANRGGAGPDRRRGDADRPSAAPPAAAGGQLDAVPRLGRVLGQAVLG